VTAAADDFAGLALDDATVAAQLPAPRKSRPYGFGGGDLAKLFLSLGRRPMESAPAWLRDECAPMKRFANQSRFLLQKAGRVAKKKQQATQAAGLDREAELFLAWADSPGDDIDLESCMYAGALPPEFPPLVDKECPRLVARIDAWARTHDGALVLPSLKLARYGMQAPAWWNGVTEAPWYYAIQSQVEMAVCNASRALLVVGCGWIRDAEDPRSDGEILVLPIERDEALIDEIRTAVTHGWAIVESLRAS
jgi:hypothetical protein